MDLIFNYYNPLELYRSRRHHDPDLFGFEVAPREMFSCPNWINMLDEISRNQPQTIVGKDGFQANVNVKHFKPEEVSVKIVDNTILIEGKHEERGDDNGEISRHFVRKFTLPEGCDPNEVVSTLSTDGVLTIKTLPSRKEPAGNERIVQIQQTGSVQGSIENGKTEQEKRGEKLGF